MGTSEQLLVSEPKNEHSTTLRVLPSSRRKRGAAHTVGTADDLGTTLRRTRRRRRVSLEEAARATRIAPRYLQALERNAPMEEFPAPAYARAFVIEYARFLRLDPSGLADRLVLPGDAPLAPGLSVLRVPRVSRLQRGKLVAVVAATALSIALVTGTDGPRSPGPASLAGALPAGIPAADPAGSGRATSPDLDHTLPHAAPAGGIFAVVRTTGRSWLRVDVDGKTVLERILPAGAEQSFRADGVMHIVVGNAAAVAIEVNGRPLGILGAPGTVRTLTVRASKGSLSVDAPAAKP
jgi:cytoskeleton protein RodZ